MTTTAVPRHRALAATLVLAVLLVGLAASSPPKAQATAAADEGNGHVVVAVGDLLCAGVGQGAVQPGPQSQSARGCRSDLVADLVDEIGPDRFLPLGDLYYGKPTLDGLLRSYDIQFGHLKDITSPAIGNHEYDVAGAEGYFAYFNDYFEQVDAVDGYYAFRLGDWLLIALNTQICLSEGDCLPGTDQYEFLEATLMANHDAGCVLAYGHHPRYDWRPFQKWIRDDDGRILYGGTSADPLAPLWEQLDDHGADVILAAHNHLYQRWAPQDADWNETEDGIVQFTVGTGGALLYPLGRPPQPDALEFTQNRAHGVLELTLREGSYDYRWVSAARQPVFSDEGASIPCN
jgi:acid phosphatase type 7